MSYENAPATTMLATHCAVCNRPLLDAESVELGIGPECRKRSGYEQNADPDKRAQANKLVHTIALGKMDFADLAAAVTELNLLGFTKLAATIASRKASVHVSEENGRLLVRSPFTDGSLDSIRRIRGRRPEYEKVQMRGQGLVQKFKGNSFPMDRKAEVWAMLKKHFPGALGEGPKGAFQVPYPDEEKGDYRLVAVRTEAEPTPKAAECYEETGCKLCGDPDFHDGEECPVAYERAMEDKAEFELARRRGEI